LPDGHTPIARLIAGLDDATLVAAIRNLGGHDLGALDDAYAAIDDDRPTVILAYTIKGYGLAMLGRRTIPRCCLMSRSGPPVAALRRGSAAARLCAETAERLRWPDVPRLVPPELPAGLGRTPAGVATTQAALGRALLDLTRRCGAPCGHSQEHCYNCLLDNFRGQVLALSA
jgi:pyruvate dehydrogenase E1 component